MRKIAARKKKLSDSRGLVKEVLRGALISSLIADIWLSYRLGISPLMSELGGAYNITQQEPYDIDKYTFKVSARHFRQRQSIAYGPLDYRGGKGQSFSCQELHGYTCTLVASPMSGEIDRAAQFGLDNLPATAWELTTLSFVVDYFVSIGNFLEALNVPKRFEFVDGSWTQRISRSYDSILVGPGTKASGAAFCSHTKRTVYTTFPVPIPPLSLNGQDLTVERFLTMASLAVVKLRKFIPKM